MTDLPRHYADAPAERERLLRSPHGRLEFLRTRELVRARLTGAVRVLDVGGGTGVHARWLAEDGHAVHLVDVVPSHVAEAARLPGVTASVGDARHLAEPDGSVDVVLLLGPLYHLVSADDRARALAEARRVLRAGGLLVAAAISRYLSVLETGTSGVLGPDLLGPVAGVIATGRYDGHVGFTETHWHTAGELADEVAAAGFGDVAVHGVEGPAWPALDVAGIDEFDARVAAALHCARLVDQDPLLVNASAHLLAFAHA
ncbi:class I SAM-dependent methyltransferase [Saccharothrix obliqua]|uniref:class I SAM-dependent methyltransferase n=1 Tax=Saccharothrix obliqua TaxID=2861747 RepID=UPI001C5D675E|nr:class I SAM-dependent methyltransferase [Saccharothrix obliqua]MBW4717911.1 class I SAM-dependent methyltransferase [Saccharothrix obliqua]